MNAHTVNLSTVIASAAIAAAMALSTPAAMAADGDAQFLSALSDLGIEFATPDEAIAAGNNVCDVVAEGIANGITPAGIRSVIVNSMVGESLSEPEATQVMTSAVAAYCPTYSGVVSG